METAINPLYEELKKAQANVIEKEKMILRDVIKRITTRFGSIKIRTFTHQTNQYYLIVPDNTFKKQEFLEFVFKIDQEIFIHTEMLIYFQCTDFLKNDITGKGLKKINL